MGLTLTTKKNFFQKILWGKPDLEPGRLADFTCPAGNIEVWISNFRILSVFEVLFEPNFGLAQRMLLKWTCCPQFLCIPSEKIFGNFTDLLMSPKTFVSNMIISKKIFQIFKTEQKVKNWKISFLKPPPPSFFIFFLSICCSTFSLKPTKKQIRALS